MSQGHIIGSGVGVLQPQGQHLSLREVDVLKHVAGGLTDKEIAARLGISPRTVHNHLNHAFQKLEAANRTQAVLSAMRLGLPIL